MPILQGALLCDAAHDYSGKVSILGGFVAATYVPRLPVPAAVVFAGRVGFSREETTDAHELLVQAWAPDETTLLGQVGATLAANPPRPTNEIPELVSGVNLVFPFPFPLVAEGVHWVALSVDGAEFSRLPLKVILGRPPE